MAVFGKVIIAENLGVVRLIVSVIKLFNNKKNKTLFIQLKFSIVINKSSDTNGFRQSEDLLTEYFSVFLRIFR